MGRMIRCSEGHFYDSEKHTGCPICGVAGLDIGKTKGRAPAEPYAPTVGAVEGDEKTHGLNNAPPPPPKDTPPAPSGPEAKTVGYWGKKMDPVVGWLVCIEGPDKGRDYRIRSEKNFLGRSPEMDIYVENDEHISRKNHTTILYNPRSNKFKLLPGEGRALVYLNGDDVDSPKELTQYDRIEMGQSKFMFVPLCGEHFRWESENGE